MKIGKNVIILVLLSSFAFATLLVDYQGLTPANNEEINTSYMYVNINATSSNTSAGISAFLDLNQSLIGYWKLDAHTGIDVKDDSPSDHPGILRYFDNNATTRAYFGNGTKFDGADDYIRINGNANYSRLPITVELWFKLDRLPSLEADNAYLAVNRYSGAPYYSWYIKVDQSTDRIRMALRNLTGSGFNIEGDEDIVVGQWYHVAGVIEEDCGFHMYVNGVKQSQTNDCGTAIRDTTYYFNIGATSNTEDNTNGTIDEVRIHHRAFTQKEVQASYNYKAYGHNPSYPNLVNNTEYNFTAYAAATDGQYNTSDSRNISTDIIIEPEVTTMYVGQLEANCDDSYTRYKASSPLYPWCTLTHAIDLLQSGDTIYVMNGEYNTEHLITGETFTKNTTIKGFPGDQANLTRFYAPYATVPNSLWTNTSTDGHFWKTDLGFSSTNWPRMYYRNTSKFFTWNWYLNFTLSDYPANVWYNTSNGELHVKFNDSVTDPNTIPLYISRDYRPLMAQGNTMTNNSYLIFEDLHLMYNIHGIELRTQSNVEVKGCTFHGGHNAFKVNNYDDTTQGNIRVHHSTFNGKQNPSWYEQDMKNEATEETQAVLVERNWGPIYVHDNDISYFHGGVTLYTTTEGECNGSEVYLNNFSKGRGSQIEIEEYCTDSVWYNNTVLDSEYGLSWAPADASSGKCEFYNNLVALRGSIRYNPTTNYQSYAIKIQNISGLAMENWDVHHNTFVGYGRAINGINNVNMRNNNFTNNIFVGMNSYVILRSGQADRGNFYDYNLYYNNVSGLGFATRWNSDTSTTIFATLAAARASGQWDGTWDNNSAELDPQFMDYDNDDFTPDNDTIVCNMSSTGGYVGALPCYSAEPSAPTTPAATEYPSSCRGVKYTYFGFVGALFLLLPLVISGVVLGLFKKVDGEGSNMAIVVAIVAAVGVAAMFASVMAMVVSNIC